VGERKGGTHAWSSFGGVQQAAVWSAVGAAHCFAGRMLFVPLHVAAASACVRLDCAAEPPWHQSMWVHLRSTAGARSHCDNNGKAASNIHTCITVTMCCCCCCFCCCCCCCCCPAGAGSRPTARLNPGASSLSCTSAPSTAAAREACNNCSRCM